MAEPAQEDYGRERALRLLYQYVKTDSLRRHALTVEGVMRHFAVYFGVPEETDHWGIAGLLHDIDYEMYPDEHCAKARELLAADGCPEDLIRAVQSHGYKLVNDVEPKTKLEKTLYAVDELTGLIGATALMHPSKSVYDLEVKSVKKKWKQKGFAAGVNRTVIEDGAAALGLGMDELMRETILGMRSVAPEIGLAGTAGMDEATPAE